MFLILFVVLFCIVWGTLVLGWFLPKLIRDELIDDLCCARNVLEADVLKSCGSLTHPAYVAMRRQLNGLVWMADRIDFFLAIACVRKVGAPSTPDCLPLPETPDNIRAAVEKAAAEAEQILKRFLFRRCVSGFFLGRLWHVGRTFWGRIRRPGLVLDGDSLVRGLRRYVVLFYRPDDSELVQVQRTRA